MAKGNTVRLWRRSLIVLMVMLIAGFGLLIFRLVQLQIVEGETLQKGAVSQQLKDTTISAKRGTIYDCNMKPLAQSANVWTVVLEPAYLTDKEDQTLVANGLAEILGMEAQDIMDKMNPNSYYTILKKKVESDVKDAILQFKTDNEITNGIRLIEDYKRYYPYGAFASAVLGCVGGDNQGLAGLEAYYDSTLTGTAGRLITAKNAIGTDMPYDYEQLVPAEDGYSLVLTIDETIQHFMEKYLEQGIINNDVQNRAAAIMMNVNTGEIYGMAVKGDFDPNDPFTIVDQDVQKAIDALPEDQQDAATSEAIQQQWRNKAVSDTYYPGSVFKIITSAMGLQEGVVDQNSTFVCTGAQMVEGYPRPIHCHVTSGHGTQTFLEALCNSCNPAFIQLGQKVGAEKFWKYYQAFGFSEPTGIDLPGEATDIFFSSDGSMTNADLAVASFGQNFSITPIQMLTAAATAVNGGKLVQPHVVKQILDSDGNIVQSVGTTVKRQVISEEVSKELCQMLQTNATIGSGKNGYVAGFRIGGKTGTSEKIADDNASDTGEDTYIASYLGFAPADNPEVVMLVYCDNPQGPSYYGSYVAAPIFRDVMEEVLPYLGIERQYTDEELAKRDAETPSVTGLPIEDAKTTLNNSSLGFSVLGDGDTVVQQIPEAGQPVPQNGTIVLYTDQQSVQNSTATVPNLVGLSAAEAVAAAENAGINIKISGNSEGAGAESVSQSVAENTQVSKGTVVTVEFVVPDNVE